jgi:DNA-binding LytR/AlgR family response regulator
MGPATSAAKVSAMAITAAWMGPVVMAGITDYISRDSIKRLAGELADFGFIRIERSLLVNIRAVLYAETVGRGRFAFTLCSGACLHSSSGYREAILRALPLASSSSRGACQ